MAEVEIDKTKVHRSRRTPASCCRPRKVPRRRCRESEWGHGDTTVDLTHLWGI